jgi:hypothetical protein
MSFTLHLRAFTCKQRYRRLQQAYASGSLQLVQHLHALVALAQGQSVSDMAEMLARGEQTVRDILPGMNARASTSAVPSPIEGSGTAWVLLGSWALSPARPTPIHPRHECRGFSALLG